MNKKLTTIFSLILLMINGMALAQGGSDHVTVGGNVFGGGRMADVNGTSTVLIEQDKAEVKGDVYGGGAYASTGATSIKILTGTIGTANDNTKGNVYGGGLGGELNSVTYAPAVNGDVTVNIGWATAVNPTTGAMTNPSGTATILGSVYGANNAKGSPTGDVTVNIYQTAHNTTNAASYLEDDGEHGDPTFAIDQVFGGGRNADYSAADKKATVNIFGCENTVRRVFGGGDAAAAPEVQSNLYGGRFDWVFGGGNGEFTAADINGDASLGVHGGEIGHLFGGSNTRGTISGATNVLIDKAGQCDEYIAEFFGGSNKVNIIGNVNTTIGCGVVFGDVYGGCNQATITGNVNLTIEGSTFNNIFGGSKGDLSTLPGTGHSDKAANIDGNVTLNLLGGTVQKVNGQGGNVFGGSNYNGNITGQITVNVFDKSECEPFSAVNLYGAGNLTAYTPTTPSIVSPEVNIIYIKNDKSISGNVFGGGLGASATVTANPKVTIGYDATMGTPSTASSLIQGLVGSTYTMPEALYATVGGNVYGGGDLGAVVGSTSVTIQHANTQIGNDVYGGGNKADVSGSVVVNVNNGTIANDVYGGGALADVNVTNNALTTGATTTVTLNNGTVTGNVYGGGLGQLSPTAIAAMVYGPVQVNALGGTIGTVFGCNNLNGAPQSTVLVNVAQGTDDEDPALLINNVYGGGNQAAYSAPSGTPDYPVVNIKNGTVRKVSNQGGDVFGGGLGATAIVNGNPQLTIGDLSDEDNHAVVQGSAFGGGNAAMVNGVPVVLVQKCNTEVGLVYGGGNAADVYATNITVTGGNEIGQVYGGCYGANVTGHTGTPAIDGNTDVLINGGTIGEVYGGNNFEGTISGRITVIVRKEADACEMHIGDLYGGGNQAASISYPNQIQIYCTGSAENDEGIDYVYGGANRAQVNGDINLNIYQGRVKHVFGGNNNSGAVLGDITVNIEKNNADCDWYVGDVYGAGNLATYTPTDTEGKYPQVNIKNGTVSGSVFGGGKGDPEDPTKGVVTGNPQVTIGYNNDNYCAIVTQNVYGGGNAAKVEGYTTVVYNDSHANSSVGRIFGGGESAGVTGNATVTVEKGAITGGDDETHYGVYGGCNLNGDVGGNITLNIKDGTFGTNTTNGKIFIHGGGYGSGTTTSGSVDVNIGNGSVSPVIYGDVYGGSALGSVNSSTGTNLHTNVTLTKGTINGSLYGGGLGSSQHAAAVYSPVQVTITTGTVTGEVYGCNNVNGAPQSTVNVDVYNATAPASGYAIGKVFGGGNQAAYGGTPDVKIHNCGNKIEYVYGGGNAASVAGTDLTVYGGTIDYVFGGCYGANVTPGGTKAKIYGGTIGQVFGANNSDGSVTGDIQVTINKQGEGSSTACPMHIDEVYGGGNVAASHSGTITVGCTGTGDNEGIGDLYGGARNANITSGDILVNITEGRIQNVYGGNNVGGSISGNITVNINEKTNPCVWSIDTVFGGGNLANFDNLATVNIQKGTINHCVFGGGNKANVGSTSVTLTDGLVKDGLYGGCNKLGIVTNDIEVKVNGGQVGVNAEHTANIFGGGYGANTHSGGDVTVKFGTIASTDPAHTDGPVVFGDIYGGSAFGTVNGFNKKTTVDILNGVVNGNIYGGGLGRKEATGVTPITATVYGKVFVNIGQATDDPKTGIGFAYLNNTAVFGCNNLNGSPQDDVTVNIWRNGRCGIEEYNSQTGTLYSIDQVFGGGNMADFSVPGKYTYVFVHDCSNSIRRVFGGSDASAAYGVNTTIHGGRYDCVFGGGNGDHPDGNGGYIPANIGDGGVHLTVTAGIVNQLYGGSNQSGTNTGGLVVNVSALNATNACSEDITEFFCGGNYADVIGNVVTEIDCGDNSALSNITSIYGGCDHANVVDWPEEDPRHGTGGNVSLTIKGGNFVNVFGGSKGQLDGYTEGKRRHRTNFSADIEGNITLNIYGGTIKNVYGGSNILGEVGGTITVNIIDHGGNCALDLENVYGGGNMTSYTPNYTLTGGATERITPMVNIIHGTVKGNVYGGAKGYTQYPATVKSSPRVIIGYDNSMSGLIPAASTGFNVPTTDFRAKVRGDVYGGGDAAVIDGNTEIQLKDRATVRGNIYGGGNMGEVTGNTKVNVNGKNQ